MSGLLFGTGGVPHSSRERSTVSGIERIHELGLDCMEMEFVQGVNMSEPTAQKVGETAERLGIKLSVHAPYYLNFNAHEVEKRKSSQKRLLQSARIGTVCGARNIVFHAAFYLDDTPEKAYATVKSELTEVLTQLKAEQVSVCLRPEVTGKETQFGNLEETVALCKELPGVLPCFDVAHYHARTGKFNSREELAKAFEFIGEKLGRKALDDMHIHFSGIAYTSKGERSHLNLEDSDLQYKEILRAIADYDVKGLVICESPNLEGDAMLLKQTYLSLD
ncbi:MAG: TIM barrel protein [Chloroflexota bacterium]